MRWPVLLLAMLGAAAAQMSVAALLTRAPLLGGAALSVDFLALLTVYVTLIAVQRRDALWTAWLTGMLIDLSVTGAPLGLNALGFTAAAAVVFNGRQALFTDSPVSQAVLSGVFCLIAHGLARLFMNLYVRPDMAALAADAVAVLMTAGCTALAAAPTIRAIRWLGPYLLAPSARRRRR